MDILRIDSVSGIDPASISFSNLRWKYGTGVDTSTGKGHDKKVSYRFGVMTELGDIKEDVWYQLMEQLIQKNGEQWLLDALIQWEKEHNAAKNSLSVIRKEALQLHSYRMFDEPQWVYFIPFNRQSRPVALEQAHLVTVISECCGIPGEVTQEQINRAYEGKVCCPHCGCWSKYTICAANSKAN